MKVIIRGYGDLKRVIGDRSTVELKDDAKISSLILELGGRVKGSRKAYLGGYNMESSTLVVLVNGRNIQTLNGVDTALKEGDFITFIPVVIGG